MSLVSVQFVVNILHDDLKESLKYVFSQKEMRC